RSCPLSWLRLVDRSYRYWPPTPPENRIVTPVSAALEEATSASAPPTRARRTRGVRFPAEAPVQSMTRTFTGIVLPSRTAFRPPPSGGSRPSNMYWCRTGTVDASELPPSSSDTTTEAVKLPAPYVWLSPATGEVWLVAVVCADPSPQSTS